ncbi:VPLPA-CTERM sorting domain-containing protein [uncultured Roseobacter sp.]|uniref:VPLPA-CTERM sorting domain-containing protein n=1 Tax=uncultured Roseobacter sp. TaxID=114847 RepID=UPI002604AF39|nr:VPLPA-CTERM sorting domain-containing protein [uncultured Roseobacter sp.]
MKNLFTLVLTAGLGLTAAVAASSLNFQRFSIADSVQGAESAGVEFRAQNAAFGSDDGDIKVKLASFSDTTVSFFEVVSLDKPFEFKSVELSTDKLFGDVVTVTGFLDDKEVISEALNVLNVPQVFTPRTFAGIPLDRLRFGSFGGFPGGIGGGSQPQFFVQDDVPNDETTISLDDVELVDVSPVPIPASMMLLGTALAGFGVMRRRKKS